MMPLMTLMMTRMLLIREGVKKTVGGWVRFLGLSPKKTFLFSHSLSLTSVNKVSHHWSLFSYFHPPSSSLNSITAPTIFVIANIMIKVQITSFSISTFSQNHNYRHEWQGKGFCMHRQPLFSCPISFWQANTSIQLSPALIGFIFFCNLIFIFFH